MTGNHRLVGLGSYQLPLIRGKCTKLIETSRLKAFLEHWLLLLSLHISMLILRAVVVEVRAELLIVLEESELIEIRLID